MVPPVGIGVVGVKARVTGTEDLPETRSDEAMVKETDKARVKIPPDDTEFDIEQKFKCNLTPTEAAVAAPNVNPPRVMVNADALMATPDVVIMTAVEEVALQVAVKPAILLKPDATVGVRDGTKKLEGYVRVKALPDEMKAEGVKTRVTCTDALPESRSSGAMPKEDRVRSTQRSDQSSRAEPLATKMGEGRLVPEVPSPTCRKHIVSTTSSPRAHTTPSQPSKRKSITWPYGLFPQQETAPLPRTAQE
jgi:hypothetical protein